jgi:hypothetical protein
MKSYPALDADAQVAVYTPSQPIPDGTEVLGTVVVADGGATVHCDSLTMMNHVQTEAKKIGGNAVLITEHRRPSLFGSNCHQFKGAILRLADPDAAATGVAGDSSAASYYATLPRRQLPRWNFGADAGIGWRINKIAPSLNAGWKKHYNSLRFGVSWNLHGNYFFTDELGIRLLYQGSRAAYSSEMATLTNKETGDLIASGKQNSHILTQYVGPSFVMRAAGPKKKWLFDASFGVGYLYWEDEIRFPHYFITMSGGAVAFQSSMGVEYRWDARWGAGFNLSAISGVINSGTRNENGRTTSFTSDGENGGEGVGRIEMLIGLRYYIK